MTVLWLGKSPPIRPVSATYLRPGPSSSSTNVPVLLSPACCRNSVGASSPPSVSNVRRSRSVVTVNRWLAAAGAAPAVGGTAPPGTAAGVAAAVIAARAALAGTVEVAAGPLAVAAGGADELGKNVALPPL